MKKVVHLFKCVQHIQNNQKMVVGTLGNCSNLFYERLKNNNKCNILHMLSFLCDREQRNKIIGIGFGPVGLLFT